MTVIAVPFHLDVPLPGFASPVEPGRIVAPQLFHGTPWDRMAVLYEAVADAVADDVRAGRRPVVVSGDCTTSLGVVAGLQRTGVEPSLVWFDGHGDVQTQETSASGYLGGMPLRQLVGGADRTAPDRLGLRAIPEADVVLVDGRDLDPPEVAFLAGSAIRRVPIDRVPLPDGPVHLHLDADVIDPRDVPGLLFRSGRSPAGGSGACRAGGARDRAGGRGLPRLHVAPGADAERVLAPLAQEPAS